MVFILVCETVARRLRNNLSASMMLTGRRLLAGRCEDLASTQGILYWTFGVLVAGCVEITCRLTVWDWPPCLSVVIWWTIFFSFPSRSRLAEARAQVQPASRLSSPCPHLMRPTMLMEAAGR